MEFSDRENVVCREILSSLPRSMWISVVWRPSNRHRKCLGYFHLLQKYFLHCAIVGCCLLMSFLLFCFPAQSSEADKLNLCQLVFHLGEKLEENQNWNEKQKNPRWIELSQRMLHPPPLQTHQRRLNMWRFRCEHSWRVSRHMRIDHIAADSMWDERIQSVKLPETLYRVVLIVLLWKIKAQPIKVWKNHTSRLQRFLSIVSVCSIDKVAPYTMKWQRMLSVNVNKISQLQ